MNVMPVTAMLIAASTMTAVPEERRVGSESSVAYRDAATGKFGAPASSVAREAQATSEIEAMERATLRLAEEQLTGPAGGVRVRLHGAFRSALAVDRERGVECAAVEEPRAAAPEERP